MYTVESTWPKQLQELHVTLPRPITSDSSGACRLQCASRRCAFGCANLGRRERRLARRDGNRWSDDRVLLFHTARGETIGAHHALGIQKWRRSFGQRRELLSSP